MVKEAKWRKGEVAKGRVGEWAKGRKGRGSVSERYKPIRPFADSPIRRFAFSSYAERQATPVAGGEVFRRRTRTLTFMD